MIADHPREEVAELLDVHSGLGVGRARWRPERAIPRPVPLHGDPPVGRGDQEVGRRQPEHAVEHRVGGAGDGADEVLGDHPGVGGAGDARIGQHRGDLRREPERVGPRSPIPQVVQRPLAEGVAGAHQLVSAGVPDREREVAHEPGDPRPTPGEVRLEDQLGVGSVTEPVAGGPQRRQDLRTVVDPAVERQPDVLGGIEQRLGGVVAPAADGDVAQVGQAHRSRYPLVRPVGAAVADGGGHGRHRGRLDRPAVDAQDPGEPAQRSGTNVATTSGVSLSGIPSRSIQAWASSGTSPFRTPITIWLSIPWRRSNAHSTIDWARQVDRGATRRLAMRTTSTVPVICWSSDAPVGGVRRWPSPVTRPMARRVRS